MGFRFSGAQVRQGSSLDEFATLVCKQNASKDHPARAENDLSQMPLLHWGKLSQKESDSTTCSLRVLEYFNTNVCEWGIQLKSCNLSPSPATKAVELLSTNHTSQQIPEQTRTAKRFSQNTQLPLQTFPPWREYLLWYLLKATLPYLIWFEDSQMLLSISTHTFQDRIDNGGVRNSNIILSMGNSFLFYRRTQTGDWLKLPG